MSSAGTKRNANEMRSSSSSSSSSTAPSKKSKSDPDGLEARFLACCSQYPDGIHQDLVNSALNVSVEQLSDTINNLLQRNRLTLFQDSAGKIIYKLVSSQEAEKFRGLGGSEMLVYQLIQKEGNMGIWIRDLRRRSNLQTAAIQKTLKTLMQRKLIKCEKSIEGKNKKVYMLYELEPAREISGGSWYSGHDFDTVFIKHLEEACLSFLKKQGRCTASDVSDWVRKSGIFTVTCSVDEINNILMALAYDGKIEKENSELTQLVQEFQGRKKSNKQSSNNAHYRYIRAGPLVSSFTTIPCSVCPVADKCNEGNPINPGDCQYYTSWLNF